MTECEKINEKLIDYINRRLLQPENSAIISHIANCESCRNEVAILIKIKKIEQSKIASIPEEIHNSAFNKINFIIENEHPFKQTFDQIYYSLKIVQQTIMLASQAI